MILQVTNPTGHRKKSSSKAYKAREAVKTEILRQRIASAFDSKKLESKFLGQQKFSWMMVTWWLMIPLYKALFD